MTRPLRKGDRVTATGTVVGDAVFSLSYVRWDGTSEGGGEEISTAALTLIEPAEPPVGSVVVKDGVAWTREPFTLSGGKHGTWRANSGMRRRWSDLSDGEIVFQPGVTE
jgi:hypothetical protein